MKTFNSVIGLMLIVLAFSCTWQQKDKTDKDLWPGHYTVIYLSIH